MQKKISFPWLGSMLIVAALVVAAGFLFTKGLFKQEAIATQTINVAPPITPKESIPIVRATEPESVIEEPQYVAEAVTPKESLEPLPRLQESDPTFKAKLSELDGGAALISLLVNDELIRKGVRMVHGLSEGFVVKEFRPIQSPQGAFGVTPTGEKNAQGAAYYEISADNANRYARYIDVLMMLKPEQAHDLYQHFYPLLQQAYEELGLANPNFGRVVLQAIDVLLEPTIGTADEVLSRPSVMFVYNNKQVEATSSVNKLKLRIGSESSDKLEQWLRAFRQIMLERARQ